MAARTHERTDVPTRQCILLPPSKGKADGGQPPAYGETLANDHPLSAARRTVMEAVRNATDLDDERLARLAGVRKADVKTARSALSRLAEAPTMPASRRYRGIVHNNAGLVDFDPDELGRRVAIVSALLGLVRADEPVPDYRLEFSGSLAGIGGLATFWRKAAVDLLADFVDDALVWDLLPAEHARIWPADRRQVLSATTELVTFRFVQPNGRAANAARTKVAKGRIAASLLAAPDLAPSDLVERVVLDEPWRLDLAHIGDRAHLVTATWFG